MSPRVSIIICTCNRAESLRQTLEAIGMIEVPADLPAELLVIDNASKDHTRQVAESARLANMPVRYVLEGRRGKGYAYNTGMASARGDILLFTDDDVRPPVEWIEGVCRPIADGDADAVAGGVRVAPYLERDWMRDHHRSWLASTHWINPDRPEDMVGANMAFSRPATYGAGMRFDPELDPGALGYYGDSLFSWQIVKRGLRLLARTHIVVDHCLDESRLRRSAFLDTAWKYGRSRAYIAYHWKHERWRLIPLRIVRTTVLLLVYRIRNGLWRDHEGVDLTEFGKVQHLAFLWQMRREVRRSRNYERHGYLKRQGVLPVESPNLDHHLHLQPG